MGFEHLFLALVIVFLMILVGSFIVVEHSRESHMARTGVLPKVDHEIIVARKQREIAALHKRLAALEEQLKKAKASGLTDKAAP